MTACLWICAGLLALWALVMLLQHRHPFDPPALPAGEAPPDDEAAFQLSLTWAEAEQVTRTFEQRFQAYHRGQLGTAPPIQLCALTTLIEMRMSNTVGDISVPVMEREVAPLHRFAMQAGLVWLVDRVTGYAESAA